MVDENWKTFDEPMDSTKLLACQAFVVDAENPITVVDMVQTDVTHAASTLVMWEAYHKWKHIPQVEHNWNRWK